MQRNADVNEWFLLSALNERERQDAMRLLSPTALTCPAGADVIDADRAPRALFFILAGNAVILREVDGNRVLLNRVGSGDSFGAASLFGDCTRFPTTIRAKTALSLLRFDEDRLSELFMAYPVCALSYIRFLTGRIRFLNDRIDSLTGRTAEGKVAKFLLTHAGSDGVLTAGMPMRQVASSLDIGRASLYRLLSDLAERNIIAVDRGCIKILDYKKLERLVNPK